MFKVRPVRENECISLATPVYTHPSSRTPAVEARLMTEVASPWQRGPETHTQKRVGKQGSVRRKVVSKRCRECQHNGVLRDDGSYSNSYLSRSYKFLLFSARTSPPRRFPFGQTTLRQDVLLSRAGLDVLSRNHRGLHSASPFGRNKNLLKCFSSPSGCGGRAESTCRPAAIRKSTIGMELPGALVLEEHQPVRLAQTHIECVRAGRAGQQRRGARLRLHRAAHQRRPVHAFGGHLSSPVAELAAQVDQLVHRQTARAHRSENNSL